MSSWTKEQLEAINKSGSNIIVSAGAGSGKTAVLSQRVLRLLEEGCHINEILVLTFTNAAAAEMKERIRIKIKENKSLIHELDLLDSAYITTFDSFALSVLKKYHYVLNISKELKIIDGSLVSVLKNTYLDEIFDDYYKLKEEKFINLITTFCIKDDKEIKNNILNIFSKLDLLIDKDNYLDTYLETHFNDSKIHNDIKEYEDLVFSKIQSIKDLLEEIKPICDNDYYIKLESSLNNLININNYDELINLPIEIPDAPRGSSDELKTIKGSISKLKDEIKVLATYTKEQIKEQILLTKDYVSVIIDIIKQLDNKINDYKFKHDVYEFNDVAKLSIKIIKENDEIKQELKQQFKEILIDEYQDTSDIQEEFINLIENNNVYMVGDIKQSIYRFRNANPYIFKTKYDNYSNNNNGIKIDLNKNFRSREEVLDDINIIFNSIMTDISGGANYRKSHNMIFGNLSYKEEGNTEQNNNIEIYEYEQPKNIKKEQLESFIIAKDIENKIENNYLIFDKDEKKLRKITYNDFVILIDRTVDFDNYKEMFTSLNIPLVQIKDNKLNDEIDLYIIKNLLKLVYKVKANEIDKEFTYLFMSISRSFLINMNDQDIYNIINEQNYESTELIKQIKTIIPDLDNLKPSSLVNKLLKQFNYYEKLITTNNIEESLIRIDKIKEYAKEIEQLGYSTLEFITYLDNLIESKLDLKYSQVDSADGVKIMTIHKSKGLEYHVCYYPGLYKEFNTSDTKEKFTYDSKYGIITPFFKEGIGTTIYKVLMKERYLKEEVSEKIRLLYVALTRAKEKMILVKPKSDKEPTNYNSFSNILYKVSDMLSKYTKNIEVNEDEFEKKTNKVKGNNVAVPTNNEIITEKNIKIDKTMLTKNKYSKESVKLNDLKTAENIEFGLKIHEQFELEDFKNPKNNYVKRFLKHFNLEEAINIIKEYEFIYEQDNTENHGIIDLIIEYEDYINIIDYKLKNIADEAYLKQLNGYKKYIENLTSKKVNIYLYSIIEDKLEEIKELVSI